MEIKNQFLARYKPEDTDFASLPPYGAAAFNSTLKGLMVSIGTTQAGKEDAIGNVQSEIEDVKGIMTQNIERVLERGERIDLLVDKTDRLGVGAHDFRVRSRGLRRRMWWKNVKLMVLLGMSLCFMAIVVWFTVFHCVSILHNILSFPKSCYTSQYVTVLHSTITSSTEYHGILLNFGRTRTNRSQVSL